MVIVAGLGAWREKEAPSGSQKEVRKTCFSPQAFLLELSLQRASLASAKLGDGEVPSSSRPPRAIVFLFNWKDLMFPTSCFAK